MEKKSMPTKGSAKIVLLNSSNEAKGNDRAQKRK